MVPVLTAYRRVRCSAPSRASCTASRSRPATRTASRRVPRRCCSMPSARPTARRSARSPRPKEEIASLRRDGRRRHQEPARGDRPPGAPHERGRGRPEGQESSAPTPAQHDLAEREERLSYVRTQLEKATELHRAQLEKIAGLTSTRSPRPAHGAGGRRGQARRHEPGARDRAAGPRGRRGARPQDRDDRDPTRGVGADGRIHRERVRAAERGHEGPHHRPGRPQHPRLRVGDRA